MFDELASKFGLKVPDTIDRLKVLVEEGRLTGISFINTYSVLFGLYVQISQLF